jgi:hypothetical protein
VEPLIVGRWVVAAWVYEREPAHVRPYDLERLRAEEALKSQRREAYHDQLLQAAIERLNFRLVRPDPVADNAEEGPDNP